MFADYLISFASFSTHRESSTQVIPPRLIDYLGLFEQIDVTIAFLYNEVFMAQPREVEKSKKEIMVLKMNIFLWMP